MEIRHLGITLVIHQGPMIASVLRLWLYDNLVRVARRNHLVVEAIDAESAVIKVDLESIWRYEECRFDAKLFRFIHFCEQGWLVIRRLLWV